MSNARVTVYTTMFCGYCRAAKSLLERENIPYESIDLSNDPERLMKLREQTGHMTVPLILLDNDELIGGYVELQTYLRQKGAAELMP